MVQQKGSQGFENSYNSYERYPLEKFFIFTIYQNYTLALSLVIKWGQKVIWIEKKKSYLGEKAATREWSMLKSWTINPGQWMVDRGKWTLWLRSVTELRIKMYLYPPKYIFCYVKGPQFRSPLHWHSKKKASSSNEIMLHKVKKITRSERTLEKTTPLLHCL